MLKSMTGFGLSRFQNEECEIEIEVKSLNSKYLDVVLRMSSIFSDKESEIRSLLQQHLERGKIFFSLSLKDKSNQVNLVEVNSDLAKLYYKSFEAIANELSADKQDLFRLSISQPDVINKKLDEQLLEKRWQLVIDQVKNAIEQCNSFRAQEGKAMAEKIMGYLDKISLALFHIEPFEANRTSRLREKLFSQIIEIQNANIDRLEQEMIYYLEKFDISEEKTRLANHIEYFKKSMSESSGRKLGFIAQEIGREINTIGSKAADANIQRLVVEMKDELEKIKEQLGNIL